MYKYLKFWSLLFLIFFINKNSTAQDFHFSQADLSPLYVSPAMTGYMAANNRFAIKYRNQWSSVLQEDQYKTMLLSYDGRICPNEGVTFAYGFNLVKDEVGFPSFRTNHYMGSIAFHVKVGDGLVASGGLQGGLLQYQLDVGNLDFENQFDGSFGFNSTLPSLESFLDRDQINLLDVGGGVFLYNNNGRPWNVGVAFHHINPKNYYAFTPDGVQDNNRTKTRWVLHGTMPFKNKFGFFSIKPLAIIQLPHWQLNLGFDHRIQFSKGDTNPIFNSIIYGVGFRTSSRSEKLLVADAVIFSVKTDIAKGLILGIGYDMNVSPLKRVSYARGGVEVSLVWEFPIKEKSDCLLCPDMNSSTYGQGKWQRQ